MHKPPTISTAKTSLPVGGLDVYKKKKRHWSYCTSGGSRMFTTKVAEGFRLPSSTRPEQNPHRLFLLYLSAQAYLLSFVCIFVLFVSCLLSGWASVSALNTNTKHGLLSLSYPPVCTQ
ncbi:hypothetical protein GQ54DRAFT_222157 [Martensiomyces pterosporus]|nr:hypothetical protein GQ54DRAFT_222157 [Martensiomyces pterosporus]